jgi:fibronectin type III domain protein
VSDVTRVLQNLSQVSRYVVRVRALNEFGTASEWSEALEFTTAGDNSIPGPPSNLVIDFVSPSIILHWNPATINSDGTALFDFRAYEVTFRVGPTSKSYLTNATHFVYSFAQNKLDFGSSQPVVEVSIVTMDVAGNRSAELTGVATNAVPPNPTAPPTLVTGFTFISVQIPGQPIDDLDGYDIYHSISSGGIYTLLTSTTDGTSVFTHEVQQGSAHYYKYKVRDIFGQASAGFSPNAGTTTLATTIEDAVPPDLIENLRVTDSDLDINQRAFVELEWDPSPAPDLAFYELRYRRAADVVFQSIIKGVDFTTQRFDNLDVDTDYYFQIRASDVSGNLSGWAPTAGFGLLVHTVADTVAPDTPTGLSASPGIESITVRWDSNSEIDFDHYELYGDDTTGFTPGILNLVFSGNSTAFTENVGSDHTRYYRLRAVDHTGNASAYTSEETGTSYETFLRDLTPPAVPTGLSVSAFSEIVEQVERAYVNVSWSANAETDLGGYQLEYKRTADAQWTTVNIPKGTQAHRVSGLLANTGYDFKVAAYDWSVNVSDFTSVSSVTTPKDSTAPSVPANPRSTVNLRTVTWAWDGVSAADFHHYEAQVATSGAFTTILHTEIGDSISFTWLGPNTGTTYHMRVRSVDVSANASAWSATATAQTTAVTGVDLDTFAPVTPTGLALTTGQEFLGQVENVYINATWNANSESDLAAYGLRIRKGSETRYQHVDVPKGNTSTKIPSLQPNTSYGVQVLAYDTFGNYSAYSTEITIVTARDSSAPGVPTNPRASISLRTITWAWNAVAAADFAYYEAQVSDVINFANILHVETGDSVSFAWQGPAYGATYYMRVRSVDVSGNTSAYTSTVTATTAALTAGDLTTAAPAVPTGLALTTGQEFLGQVENVYINATWNQNIEADLQGYSIRIRKGSETRYEYVEAPKGVFSVKIPSLQPNTTYGVQIQAFSAFGNYSAWSSEITQLTARDATPPSVPGNARSSVSLRTINWIWDPVSVADFDHYEAQVATSAAFTTILHTQIDSAVSFAWVAPASNTTYYMRVRSVDVSGNNSAYASSISATTAAVTGVDIDAVAPAVPTGLALTTGQEYNGLQENIYINATWNAVTDADLAAYSVRIRRGAETRYEYAEVPKGSTSVKFPGVQANTSHGVQVLAYDTFGNYSAWSTEVTLTSTRDAVAPPVPANPRSSVLLRTIQWIWDPVTVVDLAYYEAQVATSGAFTTVLHTETGPSISFAWVAPSANTTYYMRVRAVDVSTNASSYSAIANATTAAVTGVDLDAVAPAVPTGLALTAGQEFLGQVENVYINATWNAVADADLAAYNVRLRKGSETRYEYADVPKGSTTAKFTGLQPNTSYGVQVLAYDTFGNYSAYTTEATQITTRDSSAPAAPSGLSLTGAIRSLILQWTANTESDFDHYEIHVGTAAAFTANAPNLFSRPGPGTIETINKYWTGSAWADLVPGTTYYVKMYAVDVSGNKSTLSSEVNATTGKVVAGDVGFTIGGGNLVSNSSFELDANADGLADSWTIVVRGTGDVSRTHTNTRTAALQHGTYSQRVTIGGTVGNTNDSSLQSAVIPMVAGAQLTASVYVRASKASSVKLSIRYEDNVAGYLADQFSTVIGGTALARLTVSGVAPTNTATCKVVIQTNSNPVVGDWIEADAVQLEYADFPTAYAPRPDEILAGTITATEIADNAVTTPKIIAGAVVAGKVAANAISATEIQADAVTAVKIAANQITATHIVTDSITADKLTTSVLNADITTSGSIRTAMSGARMVMTSTGMIGYATDGTTKNFEYKNSDGSITMIGAVTTGGTITGGTFTGSTFQTNATPTTNGIIIEDTNGFRAYEAGVLNAQISRLGVFTFREGSIIAPVGDVVFTIGSASTIFKVDGSGMYLGSGTFASAPFSVNYTGSVKATTIDIGSASTASTISGALNVGITSSGRLRLGATADTGARIALTKDFIKAFSSGSTSDTTGVTFHMSALDGSVTMVGSLTSGSTITGATIEGGTFRTNATPTVNGIIIDDSNGFRAFESSSMNAQISRLGVFTFKKGSIVGTAADVSFTVGSASTIFKVDSSGLYLGSGTFSSAPFRVDYAGHVVATDIDLQGGTITGTLSVGTSATGKLRMGQNSDAAARITITKDWIRGFGTNAGNDSDTANMWFEVNRTGGMTINANIAGGGLTVTGGGITGATVTGGTLRTNTTPTTDGISIDDTNGFRAYQAGVLNAQITRLGVATLRKGSIISTAVGDVTFTVGTGTSTFAIDSSGIYAGTTSFATAPFSVTYAGRVKATGIDIGGSLGGTGSTIAGELNLTSASGKLRFGTTTDTAGRIAITKDWFRAFGAGSTNDTTAITFEIDRLTGNVTTVGAITSGGTITGTTVTGGTFQTNATPTTNGIIIEDTNGFRAYEAGVLNAQITRLGVFTFRKGSIIAPATDVSFTIGSGSTVFKVDSSGLYLGSGTFVNAPFRADYNGNVVASLIELAGGTITGALNVGTSSAGQLRLGAVSATAARIALTKDWIRAFANASLSDITNITFNVRRSNGAVFIDGTGTGVSEATVNAASGLTVVGGTITGANLVAAGGYLATSTTVGDGTASSQGIKIDNSLGFRAYPANANVNQWNASIALDGTATLKKVQLDTTGMTATDIILNSANTIITAGGTVATKNIQASTGRIGDVQITAFASSTLTAQITSGATTINVVDGSGFGASSAASGTLSIGTQAGVVSYTGKSGNQLTGVTGVTATHPIGTLVQQAGKLTAGTIDGSTINIGTNGSINFTGSGKIQWNAGVDSGILVSNSGWVRSSNYAAGSMGWNLGATGLEINDGVIRAPALQIGVSSQNQLVNSSFENYTGGVLDSWTTFGSGLHVWSQEPTPPTRGGVNTKYHNHSLKVVTTTVAQAGLEQTLTFGEALAAGASTYTPVAVSIWIKSVQAARTARIEIVDVTNSNTPYTSSSLALTTGVFTRITWRANVGIGVGKVPITSLKFRVWIETPSSSDVYYFDGAQLELSSWVSTYALSIGEIPKNYIETIHINDLSATQITAGTLTANGQITVGSGAYIQSFGYAGSTGYRLAYDKLTMQGSGIDIIGAAGGTLSMNGTTFSAVYGVNPQFTINANGVFLGGDTAVNSDVYVDTAKDRVVFQSLASGYKFIINSKSDAVGTPVDELGKVLRLYTGTSPNTVDSFYLTTDGLGFFAKGVIGGPSGTSGNKIKNSSFESRATTAYVAPSTLDAIQSFNTGNLNYWSRFFTGSVGSANPTITQITTSGGIDGGGYAAQVVWTTNAANGANPGRKGIITSPWVAGTNSNTWPASSVWTFSVYIAHPSGAESSVVPSIGLFPTGTTTNTTTTDPAVAGFTVTNVSVPNLATTFQRYAWKIVTPGTDTAADIAIFFTWAKASGHVWIDGVQLERGEVVTDYAPMAGEVLPVGGSGGATTNDDLRSANYVTNASGWLIRGDGFAEFGNVKVRGDVTASTLVTTGTGTIGGALNVSGTLTMTGSGIIRTAASPGRRMEISSSLGNQINFYTGHAQETPGWPGHILTYESTAVGGYRAVVLELNTGRFNNMGEAMILLMGGLLNGQNAHIVINNTTYLVNGSGLEVDGYTYISDALEVDASIYGHAEMYLDGWYRLSNPSDWNGIYWEALGGGIYMEDDEPNGYVGYWMRAYNSKNIYTPVQIRAGGQLEVYDGWASRLRYVNGNVGNPWAGNQGVNGALVQGKTSTALGTTDYDNMLGRFSDTGDFGRIDLYTQTHVFRGLYVDNGNKPFLIDHPVLGPTYKLQHVAIEAPAADLYYRGKVTLVGGVAHIDIDDEFAMTPGTFDALTFAEERQFFLYNETGDANPRGKWVNGELVITCADKTATVGWMVIAERQAGLEDCDGLCPDGHVLVEYPKDETELESTRWVGRRETLEEEVLRLYALRDRLPGAEAKLDEMISEKIGRLGQYHETRVRVDGRRAEKHVAWHEQKVAAKARKTAKIKARKEKK